MTLKKQNELLIENLAAVYPLIGRGFVQVGTKMMGGKAHIESTLQEIGAMEKPKPEKTA